MSRTPYITPLDLLTRGNHGSFEPINDLDWSATPDNQSILAVGFNHHVEVICQRRKTYFDEDQGWDTCWKLEIGR